MRAYRSASDLPLDRRTKAMAGNLLKIINPGLAAAVNEKPFDPEWGTAGKLIRNAHLAEAVRHRDHETLRRYFTDYWSSGTSVEFYEGFAYRFEELFLRHHAVVADHIAGALPLPGERNLRLVEVGSGDGRVLEWLSEKLDGIGEFHGVDLNEREIAKCREKYEGSDCLFFHAGDLMEWLRSHPATGTILVTNGGVLEYILRDELLELFREFRSLCSPCLIAITESIAYDHKLAQEPESLPYGKEFAFSHNYPAILHEAGFEIRWQRDRPTEPGEENYPVRWCQILAAEA